MVQVYSASLRQVVHAAKGVLAGLPPPWFFTWLAPIAAALVAAFAETIPIKLDDNLTVPFVAGLILATGAAVDPSALQAELAHVSHRIGWALLASGAMALAAWKVRSLTIGGAVVAALMGAAIFSLGGFGGFLMFLAATTVAITSWRVGQKRQGQAIATHGAGSAAASCAVGVIGAWLMAAIDADATGAVILTAGVAAWASEAVAREFEKGYGNGAAAVATVITSVTLAGLFALAFPALSTLAPFIVLGVAAGVLVHRGLDRYKSKTLVNDAVLLFANTIVAAAVAWLGVFIAGRA